MPMKEIVYRPLPATNLYVEQDGSLHESGSGDYKFVAATTGVSAAWEPRLRSIPWSAKLARSKLAAGQSAAIGQVSETDTAQPLGVYVPVGFRSTSSRFRGPGRWAPARSAPHARAVRLRRVRAQRSGRPAKLTQRRPSPAGKVKGHRSGHGNRHGAGGNLFGNRARSADRRDRHRPTCHAAADAEYQPSGGVHTAQTVSQGSAAAAIERTAETDGAGADVCTASRDQNSQPG